MSGIGSIGSKIKIREYLRRKVPHEQIAKELGIPPRTFYRYLKQIRHEDLKFMESLRGKEDFASNVKLAIDGLEDSIRRLIQIAESAERDADKIDALNLRIQTELDLLNVAKLGPSGVSYNRIQNRVRGFVGIRIHEYRVT